MLHKLERNISILEFSENVRKRMPEFSQSISDEKVLDICKEVVFSDLSTQLLDIRKCSEIIRQVFCTLRCELEILQDIADDKGDNGKWTKRHFY